MSVYLKRGAVTRPDPDYGAPELVTEHPTTGLTRQFVVGLDPSLTAFGVTVMAVDDPDHWATWVIRSGKKGLPRLAEIRQTLMTILSRLNVCKIVIEGYSFGSSRSQAHALGELGGTIRMALFDSGFVPLGEMPPSTLKKFATGAGNSKKAEMLLQVFKRWDVEFDDDNAADSYALARAALALKAPEDDMPKFQQDALSKISTPQR